MDYAIVKAGKECRPNEDPSQCVSKDMKSMENDIMSYRQFGKRKPEHVFMLDSRIPKQIISFDEQYLRYCLELIQFRALKIASRIPSDMAFRCALSKSLSSINISSANTCYVNEIVSGCSSIASADVEIGSAQDSILGAITGSKSMINILKSPLLGQVGTVNVSANVGSRTSEDAKEHVHYDFENSPREIGTSTSLKVHSDAMVLRQHLYGPEHASSMLSSPSSTSSTFSDQSSSCAPANVSRGMLHCTWNDGFPHYIFSVDDQSEIFRANLLKVESPQNKVMEYIYTFHSRTGGIKIDEIHENESELVGKMRVSTLVTLLPDNGEIMETQFVLSGSGDDFTVEIPTSSHIPKKNKGFSKKLVDVFKASHTYKRGNTAKLRVSNSILEHSSSDPCQDSPSNLDSVSKIVSSENNLPPNLELAAMIMQDHLRDNNNEANIGGWGMKFLKKIGNRRTDISVESQAPTQSCLHNKLDCSVRMDILIPAGIHGGPRTRNGGPSSLIERWKSGGHCDCGGWDIGCPLTVLKVRPNSTEVLSQADIRCERQTFDLFAEGSKQVVPTMRMVNIHDATPEPGMKT